MNALGKAALPDGFGSDHRLIGPGASGRGISGRAG